ncbi:MAG: O-antigen ligase family protein [Clostridiales bacterium]|nr:O-antigen ligase family protein [Clostridiales bacterium]
MDNSEKKKKKAFSSFSKKFSNSLIVHGLNTFTTYLNRLLKQSVFGKVMTSYDTVSEWASKSVTGSIVARNNRTGTNLFKKVKYATASGIESSFFANLINKIGRYLLSLPLATYGIFAFTYGLFIVITYLFRTLAFELETPSSNLVLGIVVIAISILPMFAKRSLEVEVHQSKILYFILYTVLGIRPNRDYNEEDEPQKQNAALPYLLGIALAMTSVLFDPMYLVYALGILLVVILVFTTPEAGITISILFLPFIPTMALAALVILTFLSIIMKWICGKRTLKFHLIDLPVVLFMISVVFGGFFSVSSSSISKALLTICMIGGYFIVKNLMRSGKLGRKFLNCISISSFFVAAYGIYGYLTGNTSTVTLDATMFADISGRAISTFGNSNVLGEYLLISIPITAVLVTTSKSTARRVATTAALLTNLACLILTWSRGAWLGLAISAVIFLLYQSKYFFTAGILASPLIITSFFMSGGNVTDRIKSMFTLADSSSVYRLNIWKSVLKMLKDTFEFGIGIGQEAFQMVFPQYALSGTSTVAHTHNLYLQIISEMGIGGIITFVLFAFVFIQLCCTFASSEYEKGDKMVCVALMTGIIGLLIMGFTDHIWFNYRILLLFWMIAGLAAGLVTSRKESVDFNYEGAYTPGL